MKLTKAQLLMNAEAMKAFVNGEPIQFLPVDSETWRDYEHSEFMPAFTERPFRPKSAPKTRPWNCPEDVPGPVCWIKSRDEQARMTMVCGIGEDGISGNGLELDWRDLSEWEWSLDRKTWSPCENGKEVE